MKFAKVLFTVSFLVCVLFGLMPDAMSRDEAPGRGLGTSEDQSTVGATSADEAPGPMIILYGTRENAGTRVPPPPMQKLSEHSSYFRMAEPQFMVTYSGFTDEARAAFQYAVDVWDSLIRSPVPIRIDATFIDFSGYEDGRIILGGAYPAGWKSPRALDLWFVDALADKKAGRDLEVGEPDIITRFNSHADVNWYFGTDGNTPQGKMDFVSTVIHEIGHGLGFFSAARVEESPIGVFSFSADRGKLRGGIPELPHIYDVFVVNGSGTAITTFPDPSDALLDQFTSNDLFWNGQKGIEANGGTRPQLYVPSAWDRGSGYVHLDETLFPPGEVNSLMTPYLDRQEAIHNPGPITLGMFEDMEWTINKVPVFADGSRTTRTVAENTGAGIGIGNPVVATDANNDALIYQLGGVDAASFDIDSTSGQLKTKAALHHETKASYTVTITVSDGGLVAVITVTITVINVVDEVPTNSAPEFVDDSHTTRSVAENTPRGVNIGDPVTATDADNDSLTYVLSGLDATSFDIDGTTGQLKTRAALDYEAKRAYTVTVTVSDGSLTDTITVTINVTDLDDQRSPTIALVSQPLMETTLNESTVTLTLSNRVYEGWLNDSVTVSGIAGVTVSPSGVDRVSDTELVVKLTFDGTDFDTNATLTFTVKPDAIANYDGPALTVTTNVTAALESVAASSAVSLTEATLDGSVVTLTLSGGVYEPRYTVGNNVTVSGITGVTVNRFNVERVSDTQVNVELIFDGTDFDTDATLTFRVGADALSGYNGAALITQLPVVAVVEGDPIITAFAPQPLTEVTLNESIVTLTLSSGVYTQSSSDIGRALQVSGIAGVTFRQSDVERVSDTQVNVELIFDGTDFDTDTTLTFTVAADAIANYNGPALITRIRIAAVVEERPTITILAPTPFTEANLDESTILLTLNNGTYIQSNADIKNAVTVSGIAGVTIGSSGIKRVSDRLITVELEFDGDFGTNVTLTFIVETDAIAEYDGPALIAQVHVTGAEESVVASTPAPLTETTLNGSIVTLTLNGAIYERSSFNIRGNVKVSGIEGVTFHWFDLERVSDTALTIELTFEGNFDTNATLTFTVEAGAIAGYDGPALTAQLIVTGGKESVAASTAAPLTEVTLNESVVTLTLTGAKYARSIWDIRGGVEVSGVDGVTVGTFGVDRVSDTEITVELEFDGDFDADTTLTFKVGSDALLRYDGPALTAQVPVTGGKESVVASTTAPLTEATLHESVVTLTLSGRTYERSSFRIRDAVKVSGIDGVTIGTFGLDRVSDTVLTIELTFDGSFDADATLTFTVGADAIVGYGGPAMVVHLPVTAEQESVVASTVSPLTEVTLDESVVTLTLSGAKYARSIFDLRDGVEVSGIDGVTIGTFGVDRVSDTKITVELEFDGTDFDTAATLTFTLEADAIAGYNGPAFTVQVSVAALAESVVASTASPLTEATLDGSVVTLTLNGAKYERSIWKIRDAVTVSGINAVTIPWNQPDRTSDTEITVELEFDGNIDTDSTLTFTVGTDAIANYSGAALTAQVAVTADRENFLLANFPNPFNPETWIPYQLAKPTEVTITIYAVNGRMVRRLLLGYQAAGVYQTRSRAAYWDGRNAFGEPVASGVYFYTLTTEDFTATRKMLIRK